MPKRSYLNIKFPNYIMQKNQSNNSRLAKNTLLLYVRMFVMMGISLFTSRLILQTLGVRDFGIYNVVSGAIMTIGFITSSFASASSRFITIAIGKNNMDAMKATFGGIMSIQCILAIFIILLAETLGLWFVNYKLVIPSERIYAAMFVYQISIITCIINIISIPYNAEIVAHEKMDAFAYISIFDAIMKLLIVYMLYVLSFDKLTSYSFLLLIVQCIDFLFYFSYSFKKFPETRGKIKIDKDLSKEVMKYTSWTLTGALTNMTCNQGINILLNLFFGPAVNAARGVAFQVQMVIQNFANNFQTALNPQIVKSFAAKDNTRMEELLSIGTKFSFYMLLVISLPVILKIDFLLQVWLFEVPDYTSNFIIFLLLVNLVHCALANPLIFAINATGDIKIFQIVEGVCLLSILPVAYLFYKFGDFSPNLVFLVYLIIEIITQAARVYIVLPKVKIKFSDYFRTNLLPLLYVLIPIVPITLALSYFNKDTWVNFFLLSSIELLSVAVVIYSLGITNNEREFVKNKINSFLK